MRLNAGSTASAREWMQRLMRTGTLRSWREPDAPDAPGNPFAGTPVPRRRPPHERSGAVAVAEPDEE